VTEHRGGGTATSVLLDSPPGDPASAKRFVLAPAAFGGGTAVALVCVILLSSLHAKIESAPPPPPDPLNSDHVQGLQPAFTKVVVGGAGANAWDVTLTLADLHTQAPVSSVVVTLTGNGPDGAKVGPEDFTSLGEGRYRGRVSGPPGGWDLSAAAVAANGVDVPRTQQSFSLELSPNTNAPTTPRSGPAS
jgi:hypothetical protein